MITVLTRFTLFLIAIVLATISISLNAQAQTASAGPNESAGTAVRPELHLSDLLAQAARNRRRTPSDGSSNTSATQKDSFFDTAQASGPSLPVTGVGTLGRLTRWSGFTNSNSAIGDSTVYEDKNGRVGIGTDSPTSRLSVAGVIESLSGGIKFPDGTVQSTSSTGALFTVQHDSTLMGDGTAVSPLGVSSPLAIRDLDNPARQPFQARVTCSATIDGCSEFIPNPPAGKRLVIEYVTMQGEIPPGQVATFQIDTTAGGEFAVHDLGLSLPAVAFGFVGRVVIAQRVRLYADPGVPIHAAASRNGSGSTVHFSFSISGYLVDLP